MRTIALASVSLVLIGTACSDRSPTAANPIDAGSAAIAREQLSNAAVPVPRSGERILVDARPSINAASGIWRAVDGIAPNASYTGTWTFTSNVDGQGTNALRLDVQPRSTRSCKMGTNAVNIPLPKPFPSRMVVQWKQRLGRTTTGGGENKVGTYVLDDVCNGINRSELRVFRQSANADSMRLEYQWGSGATPQVMEYKPNRVAAALNGTYDPRQTIGRTVTKTMYLQAESAPGANDGIVALWVDGQLVMQQTHAPLSAAAFKRINFPGRMALPVKAQTEYWWDMLAWVPATSPIVADTTGSGGSGGDTTSTGGDTTSTGGDTTSTGGQDTTVATITISPSSPSVLVGGSVQLRAVVQNASGDTLAAPVTWTTSAPAVATISSSGLVRGVSAGSATITASAQDRSASTIVTVGNAPVATATISPKTDTMTVGATRQLSVTLRDASGNTLSGRSVAWRSLDATLASVDSTGLAKALAAGTARVTATSEGVADTATLTISNAPPAPVATVTVTLNSPSLEVGQVTTAVATMKDAQGNTLSGRAVAWSSSNTAVATVDTAGRVRAVAAGSASIVATSEGRSGSATITVTAPAPAPVATVTVTPATASVQAGTTVQLTATTKDANGNTLTGRVVSWTSSNGGVATVSSSGLVTGVSAGSATITATSEGRTGTSSVTVTAPQTGGTTVDPTMLPVASGQAAAAGTYGRSLSSGQSYVDPLTGVTVLKVSDARTPLANSGQYGNYSEGGPYISQPWTGTDGGTYYTLWLAGNDGWFVDVKYPAMTLSNWRRAPASNETQGAWSLNPATPRIFFYGSGNTVNRYDTQAMAMANTGRFPWVIPSATGSNIGWIQTQLNDTWIVGMMNSNSTIVGWRQSDGFQRTITEGAYGVTIDEPHIDRQQPVVYVSRDNVGPQNLVVNLETGVATAPPQPNGDEINDDHNAPLRGRIVGVSWSLNAIVAVDYQGRRSTVVSPSPSNPFGDYHMAGQWVNNNPGDWFMIDQWQSSGGYKISRGMIGIASANTGDVRLLAYSDATGSNYAGGQPHPTFSPDGKLMFFCSNMNGSSRFDVFLVKLPTR